MCIRDREEPLVLSENPPLSITEAEDSLNLNPSPPFEDAEGGEVVNNAHQLSYFSQEEYLDLVNRFKVLSASDEACEIVSPIKSTKNMNFASTEAGDEHHLSEKIIISPTKSTKNMNIVSTETCEISHTLKNIDQNILSASAEASS